jgi:hypothetical protein
VCFILVGKLHDMLSKKKKIMSILHVMNLSRDGGHYRLVSELKVQHRTCMGQDPCEFGRNLLL